MDKSDLMRGELSVHPTRLSRRYSTRACAHCGEMEPFGPDTLPEMSFAAMASSKACPAEEERISLAIILTLSGSMWSASSEIRQAERCFAGHDLSYLVADAFTLNLLATPQRHFMVAVSRFCPT